MAPWAVAVWLVVWQLAAWALGSDLLLPGPVEVLVRTAELAGTAAFWGRVGFSLARIALGFAAGAVAAALAAVAAARWHAVETLAAPLMLLMKSVPVASITVLALIWLRAANLAVLVVALVVVPIVYENVLEGLRSLDPRLRELAHVLRIRPGRRARLLEAPHLLPHLRSALTLGLGMAWKAGVAAEVIGIPAGSLGEALYDTKITFDTAGLFAVTLAVVVLSAACTGALRLALAAVEPVATGAAGAAPGLERINGDPVDEVAAPADAAGSSSSSLGAGHAPTLTCAHVAKSFGDTPVLNDISLSVCAGTPCCLMAPSGCGKTTLLAIVAGLTPADAGTISYQNGDARHGDGRRGPCDARTSPATRTPRISLMFQDDRLAEQASVLANARIALESADAAWDEAPRLLEALGLGDHLLAPASSCSGGQRRRVALARTLLTPHEVLLLDEPFTGLDPDARANAAAIVRDREQGRVVLLATHDEHDAELLGAEVVRLNAASNGPAAQASSPEETSAD